MGNSIYGIGVSGLAAAQAGLLTTGHNITNVNTPGYSRQEALQAARQPQFTGGGYIGQGVNVTSVRRVYSDFLATQTLQSQAGASHLDTYNTELGQLSNLFSDATNGLAPALSDFFAGVNAVAAHPADIPSRQALVSSAQSLVSRFQTLNQQLDDTRAGINSQVASTVGNVNALASDIASLNHRIAVGYANGGGQPPNDLLDQRDDLLMQLNQQLGATSVTQSDGSVNVFLANGQAIVVGEESFKLTAAPDPTDPRALQVGLQTGATVLNFNAGDLSGGSLGGLLAYRANVLDTTQNSLGRIAIGVAQSFNDQHKLGIDLNGQLGTDFFKAPVPHVQSSVSNTGSANLSATLASASALTTSDYSLRYNAGSYTLTRLSDNTQQTFATLPQTVDGVSIVLASGTPANGDSFLIQPTRFAAGEIRVVSSDATRIAAGAPIRTAVTTTNTGSGQISQGSVSSAYPASPLASTLTLSYSSATGLSGFPAGQPITVTLGSASTSYPAGSSVPYTDGATISFGGISISINGTPANGDSFTVGPNTSGSGDNRNANLLAGVQSATVLANGTASLGDAYGQLVSFVGNNAHQAQVENDAQAKLLSQAQQAQQGVSGVNLDEEAANLQRYQQAYQAAGKVLVTANAMFDAILEIARG